MNKTEEFNFARARKSTSEEIEEARKAIEEKLGIKRPPRMIGRPPKKKAHRHKAISIRLHPKVLYWAKQQAKKRGIGYQTVMNEALLKLCGQK